MQTMMISAIVSLAIGTAMSGIAGCASAPEEDLTEQDDGLRVLEPNEMLGTIAYGQTKRVNYSPIPRYRALSFQANAGDQISIAVRGIGNADPIAFLLAGNYTTLVRNDNESSSSRNAKISYTAKKAGKYFIAVREMDEETSPTSRFDVELSKTNAPATPQPKPSKDPFDPASCSGPALSQSAIVGMFPAGQVGERLFPGSRTARIRTCTELGGCSPWRVSQQVYPKHRWYDCDRDHKACATDKASLIVEFRNSVDSPTFVGLEMRTSDFSGADMRDRAINVYDGKGSVSLANLWDRGNLPETAALNMDTYIEGNEKWGSAFDIDLRASCFRAVSKFNDDSPNSQQHTEAEIVFMGNITP